MHVICIVIAVYHVCARETTQSENLFFTQVNSFYATSALHTSARFMPSIQRLLALRTLVFHGNYARVLSLESEYQQRIIIPMLYISYCKYITTRRSALLRMQYEPNRGGIVPVRCDYT